MVYEDYYEIYLKAFMRTKSTRGDVWDASGFCSRLLFSILNGILTDNYTTDADKFEKIKAMSDAYGTTFPPDEA